MVARNIADVSSLFAVMVRRRAFFQEDPSIVSFAVWLKQECLSRRGQKDPEENQGERRFGEEGEGRGGSDKNVTRNGMGREGEKEVVRA